MHRQTIEAAKQRCRELRKSQTESEKMLWQELRNRKLVGEKLVRQYPIFFTTPSGKEAFYIADFYCHRHRLVIELDGRYHYYQRDYDDARTDIIEGMGIKIVRFQNKEVENNLAEVLRKITEMLLQGTHPVVPLLRSEGHVPLLIEREGVGDEFPKPYIRNLNFEIHKF